jgi:hypothetical protein
MSSKSATIATVAMIIHSRSLALKIEFAPGHAPKILPWSVAEQKRGPRTLW